MPCRLPLARGFQLGPEVGRLGERPLADLRRVGLADHDRSGAPQPPHQPCIGARRLALSAAAECRRLPGQVDVVLDRDRNPQKGGDFAVLQAPVGSVGFRQRSSSQTT